jgi:hypothetical protein
MPMLRELARCSRAERRMLARAAVAVPLVRLALSLLPFRTVHRAVARAVRRGRRADGVSADRVIWGVRAVAARVPAATCLTQALAASVLLSRYGHEATLRVGVARDAGGHLRAHAWLESHGEMILGAPAPGAFHPLPPLVLS